MRRRSGALHSESEEDFLLLAELSHEKTGCFYDEALHKQMTHEIASRKKSHPPAKAKLAPNHFEGFDFSMEDREKQEEMKELSAENKVILSNFVLIGNNQTILKQILMELWPGVMQQESASPERRGIDLHIVNFQDTKKCTHCFRFWIIETQFVNNPMYTSYLKRAVKVLNFSEGGGPGEHHSLQNAKEALQALVSFAY